MGNNGQLSRSTYLELITLCYSNGRMHDLIQLEGFLKRKPDHKLTELSIYLFFKRNLSPTLNHVRRHREEKTAKMAVRAECPTRKRGIEKQFSPL